MNKNLGGLKPPVSFESIIFDLSPSCGLFCL